MPTSAAIVKRDQAKVAADALIEVNGVIGVCVFGSVARGQANLYSDIDLLVLGVDPKLKPSLLYKMLPSSLRNSGIMLSYFTPERLARHLVKSDIFSVHLKRDGWIVYDKEGDLARLLAEVREINPQREVVRQLRLLRTFSYTNRFGGRFLFPLAHIYRIARTVTYAQLADRDLFEFDQDVAFRLLVDKMPQWRDEIAVIERLAPFYVRTRDRSSGLEFPFDPNGPEAEAEFLRAYDAVATIAGERDGRVG